jgi:hypothetical protein
VEALVLDQLLELPTVAGEDDLEVIPRCSGNLGHSSGLSQVVAGDRKNQCLHRAPLDVCSQAPLVATAENSTPCLSVSSPDDAALAQPLSFKNEASSSGRMLQSQGSPIIF